MKKLTAILLAVFVLTFAVGAGVAVAADKVGSIDELYVLSQSEKFQKAQESLQKLSVTKTNAAKAAFDKETDEKKKAQIVQNVQLELREAENKAISPILSEINGVINKVAKSKGITIVLNRRFVLYGGVDITEDVVKEIKRL